MRRDRRSICSVSKLNGEIEQIKKILQHNGYPKNIVNAPMLLFTRPLPRDGGMAEDPEAGQLLRVWTRGRTETESRQRVSGAKSP